MFILHIYEKSERTDCENASLYDKNLKNFHQNVISYLPPYKIFFCFRKWEMFIFSIFVQKCSHTPFPKRWLYLTAQRSLVTWHNWQTTIDIYALQFLHPLKHKITSLRVTLNLLRAKSGAKLICFNFSERRVYELFNKSIYTVLE